MDPLRPVDPDEESAQEAANRLAAIRSDAETLADTHSTPVEEPRPADDRTESTDHPARIESDSVPLPALSSEASASSADSIASDDNKLTPTSGPNALANDVSPEQPSASFDFSPAAQAEVASDTGLVPSIEPVDTVPKPDVIPPPGHTDSDMAGDLALPDNSWLESQADISAILQQPPPPVVDVGNSDAPIHFSEAGLAADVSSSLAAQRSSPETSINDRENHDRASGADAKSAPVDSRIATPPIEPKEEAALREYIERFIENFNEQSARTRALLSPAADGGPPGTN